MGPCLFIKMAQSLLKALDEAEIASGTRAIVIRGEGRNFCSGIDLFQLLEGGQRGVRVLMDPLRELMHRIERSHLPVVAAVHGAARAGGLEIALACDVIVAASSATFGDAHLANGLLPSGGSTARLPRSIGWQRAKWLILSASAIAASTAKEWGLVFEVTDDESLLACAKRVAISLSQADPATFALAKRLLAGTHERPFSSSLEAEIVTLEAHAGTEVFQRGISAFLNR
jgi:enoyl-CoA hydratase/carnithine racemase